jgi:hypothetical protein
MDRIARLGKPNATGTSFGRVLDTVAEPQDAPAKAWKKKKEKKAKAVSEALVVDAPPAEEILQAAKAKAAATPAKVRTDGGGICDTMLA